MNLRQFFRRRNPGRELALIGAQKRRRSVNEVARQIRAEIGLEPHPALEGSRR